MKHLDDSATATSPLRLWPGVVAVALQWFCRFALPVLAPETLAVAVLGGLVGGVLVLLWWAFWSRAPRLERWGGSLLMIAALALTPRLAHPSIQGGMMGLLVPIYAVPTLSLALVAWAWLTRRWTAPGPRRAGLLAAIAVGCGGWLLVRTGGLSGGADSDFAWRWTPTPEERLLAQKEPEPLPPPPPEPAPAPETAPEPVPVIAEPAPVPTVSPREEPAVVAAAPIAATPAPAPRNPEWPGFRGGSRDGIARGTALIATDWVTTPPVELWRRPVGPGWSSFVVDGDVFYTQEQRGDDEVVACYRLATGEPVWRHRDPARFWESNGGAGPRGTPVLHDGRIYSLGATGVVNSLDARTGRVLWSRNAATDTGAKLPDWGFSGSPLVYGDLLLVAASGTLAAYDLAGGEPRWIGPAGGTGYSSPHLVKLGGVEQVLQLDGAGLTSFEPTRGTVLWRHEWKGYPIVQPAVTADGDVLIAVSSDGGLRRLAATPSPAGWTVEERWTSLQLKPYFNDFVVHAGHAYGFDGRMLAAIDLATGQRAWKGGRYGHGQLVLLPEQDLLLVLSEQGELALVRATPGEFVELARFPAITGKTWNHPVVVGDLLLVRNDQEMAAFRLPKAQS
ncbi:MAG: PQQ-binding-like beta-propeller repeat protein [Thermoanaerobaculia bacterium]|nr:PQQ-binding-like beta-propeller repeat protein [Thermoanaerobaculia bacterium]